MRVTCECGHMVGARHHHDRGERHAAPDRPGADVADRAPAPPPRADAGCGGGSVRRGSDLASACRSSAPHVAAVHLAGRSADRSARCGQADPRRQRSGVLGPLHRGCSRQSSPDRVARDHRRHGPSRRAGGCPGRRTPPSRSGTGSKARRPSGSRATPICTTTSRRRPVPVDLALVPVGGWGPSLGPGHLDPVRAAEAVRRVGASTAVPVHFGTFWPIGLDWIKPELFLPPGDRFKAAMTEVDPAVKVEVAGAGRVDRGGRREWRHQVRSLVPVRAGRCRPDRCGAARAADRRGGVGGRRTGVAQQSDRPGRRTDRGRGWGVHRGPDRVRRMPGRRGDGWRNGSAGCATTRRWTRSGNDWPSTRSACCSRPG